MQGFKTSRNKVSPHECVLTKTIQCMLHGHNGCPAALLPSEFCSPHLKEKLQKLSEVRTHGHMKY